MNSETSPDAFHYQEIVFSLMMGLVAAVNREDPLVSYPEILWAFAVLLSASLLHQLALRRFNQNPRVALAAMAVNITLISAVLSISGGARSSFWPLYLLPIFTACLYLESWHVTLAVAAAAAFLGCFYLEDIWNAVSWQPYELFIKIGALALAAAVTMPLAFRERAQRLRLQADREAIKRESLRELAPHLAHDMNNHLAVILGSVELLLREAAEGTERREDLERIQSAARRCAKLANNLLTEAAR